ncbi:MAG: ArsR/SmtB family transcription factor [Elusimicrobiales bacterium]|jgi:ArsR family transcriptional regulator
MANGKIFEKAKSISDILSCLSSPTRLIITCMLIDGEKNVTEILEKIGTTKGNISQHLKILTLNKVLENRREGNKIFYYIKDKRIISIVSNLKKLYCPDFKI